MYRYSTDINVMEEKVGPHQQIEALTKVINALEDLNQEQAGQVLTWAADMVAPSSTLKSERETQPEENDRKLATEFEEFADLFFVTDPSTQGKQVLVAGYWFQEIEGLSNLDARTVNDALKNLGHPISNITRAFKSLINRTPKLALQVQKTGSSKQARNQYKITTAGIREVKNMIKNARDDVNP